MHRIGLDDVPASVREAIEGALGSTIVRAVNQEGGFSPSLAAACDLADGRRVFVKAVSPTENPDSPGMLRHELLVSAALPLEVAAPGLLAAYDDGEWVAGAWTFVVGRRPGGPWTAADLRRVGDAVRELAAAADPNPVAGLPRWADHRPDGWALLAADPPAGLDGWSRRHLDRLVEVEHRWADAVDGTALVHNDVRSDNLLVDDGGRVWFTDWANAREGAPWVDVLGLVPAVHVEGGPPPEEALAATGPLPGGPDRSAVDAYLVALAGYFTHRSHQPPPQGIPHLRPFQAAQAEVTRRWLAGRLGWR